MLTNACFCGKRFTLPVDAIETGRVSLCDACRAQVDAFGEIDSRDVFRAAYARDAETVPDIGEEGDYFFASDLAIASDDGNMYAYGYRDYTDYGAPIGYVVPCTTWGDYVGDDVQRSNWRSILRDFGHAVRDVVADYGTHFLIIGAADVAGETLRVARRRGMVRPATSN